jgi:transcriptional regulator with XRE-family HTH domain
MSNQKRFEELVSNTRSTWRQDADWREANEGWLSLSFDIAVRILDTLRANGLAQKDLAERMSVSPQFINKILKGEENMSLETISKLSIALDIKLIDVVSERTHEQVEYDFEQAYVVSEIYRQQFFTEAATRGFVGMEAIEKYERDQTLEYKVPA